jgi:hypothetical protein
MKSLMQETKGWLGYRGGMFVQYEKTDGLSRDPVALQMDFIVQAWLTDSEVIFKGKLLS